MTFTVLALGPIVGCASAWSACVLVKRGRIELGDFERARRAHDLAVRLTDRVLRTTLRTNGRRGYEVAQMRLLAQKGERP